MACDTRLEICMIFLGKLYKEYLLSQTLIHLIKLILFILLSFQMANMFLELIGKVDVLSNAENIKNLCKIAYDKKSVSK